MRTLSLVLVLLPGAALAQTDFVGVFTASGGYTDNVLSAPNDPIPPDPGPEPDSFARVAPGILASYDGSLSAHRLGYTFLLSVYANHREARSYLNRLAYDMLYLLSPTTDLQLVLAGEQGEQNGFTSATEGTGVVAVLPPGPVKYFSGSALESIQWSMSARWRFIQELGFEFFYPIVEETEAPQPRTYVGNSHLGLQRETETNYYGLDLRNTYGVTTEQLNDMMEVVIPEQAVVINTLFGRWRRDLSRDWEVELAAGPMLVFPADDTSVQVIEPAGEGALRYITEDHEVELQVSHGAGVNVFLGQTYITDAANLRGGLPLVPEGRLAIGANIGFLRGREFDIVTGHFTTIANVFNSEASIVWRPEDQFTIALRYSFFTQSGELTPEGMMIGAPQPIAYLRNTVLLEVSGTVGQSTPRNRRRIPAQARVGGERRDFIEGDESGGGGGRGGQR